MTIEEARAIYGQARDEWKKKAGKAGYVPCNKCPVYGLISVRCPLLKGKIPGKYADGYDNCWEYIAKVMTEQEAQSAKQETESAVDHPSHYAGEKYECIEVMREVFGEEATKHFCLLNAFKYIWRSGKKHKSPYEDINKAIWYLNKYLATKEENE